MASFISNSIYTILNKIGSVVFTFVALVVIARGLGPNGQGEYSFLVQLVRTAFYFFSFGIPSAFIFYLGRHQEKYSEITKTFFYFYFLITFLALGFSYMFAVLGHKSFFSGISNTELLIALSTIPLWFGNSFLAAIYKGQEQFRQLNLNNISQPVVMLIGVAILFIMDRLNVEAAVIVYLISNAINLFLNLFYLDLSNLKTNFSHTQVDKSILKKTIPYSFKTYVGNISEFLIYKSDIYIIAFFLSKAELGIYVIAVNLVERLWTFSEPISSVLFSKLVNLKSEEKRNFFTIYTLQGTFLISITGAIGLYLFGALFIKVFFGENYIESVTYLYILLPGVVLQSMGLVMKKILGARGYPGTNALSLLFCLILNVALNIILIPEIGVRGAAISTTIAYTAYFLFLSHSLKKKFNIKKRDYIILKFSEVRYLINDLMLRKKTVAQ